MTVINLTDQRTLIQGALPTFQAFQAEMDKRKAVWDKLTPEQRKRWINSSSDTLANSKDPVMWLAVQLHQYLSDWKINEDE